MSGSLKKIEQMICGELDEIASRGTMDTSTLDTIDKCTHSLKSIEYILSKDKTHGEADGEKEKIAHALEEMAKSVHSDEYKQLLSDFARQVK